MKKSRRSLRRRELSIDPGSEETTYMIHAQAPKTDFITNWTNILTPETSNGPYFYPRSQILRQDIRGDQAGVPLSLEIGVIDVDTCEAVEDVLVDIWVSSTLTNIQIQLSVSSILTEINPAVALQCNRLLQLIHRSLPQHSIPGYLCRALRRKSRLRYPRRTIRSICTCCNYPHNHIHTRF